MIELLKQERMITNIKHRIKQTHTNDTNKVFNELKNMLDK